MYKNHAHVKNILYAKRAEQIKMNKLEEGRHVDKFF